MSHFLREKLLNNHDKKTCLEIAQWVGESQSRFNQLLDLTLYGDKKISSRASWPLNLCGIENPDFLEGHFEKLIEKIGQPGTSGTIKRNVIRIFQFINFPGFCDGQLMNLCFQFVETPSEPVAVKAFALSILGKLSEKYPEIKPELCLIIRGQLPHQSAAFKVRAKRILEEFEEK